MLGPSSLRHNHVRHQGSQRRVQTQVLSIMAARYRFRVELEEATQEADNRSSCYCAVYYKWDGRHREYLGSSGWERGRQYAREVAANQAVQTLLYMGYLAV